MANRQAKKMSLPPEIFTIIHPYLSLHDISSLILTNNEVNRWVDMNDMIREYYVSLMDGGNIIEAACKRGFINLITHLHRTGTSLPDDAIIWAMRFGHLPIVEYLRGNGVDLSANHHYPIRLACQSGHLHIIKYLHENGVDLPGGYEQPIIGASSFGHLPIVEYVHKNGADTCACNNSPIILASRYGHLPVVEYLHKNGADIHASDNAPFSKRADCGTVIE
jgi:hypothetical protein